MEKYITSEQIYDLQIFGNHIDLARQDLEELCRAERDDIVYGFELGKIHGNLKKLHDKLFYLKKEIEKQNVTTTIKNNDITE